MMPLKSETSFGVGAPNEVGIALLTSEHALDNKHRLSRQAFHGLGAESARAQNWYAEAVEARLAGDAKTADFLAAVGRQAARQDRGVRL